MVTGQASYNVYSLWSESVKCSKITNIQGDEMWLLVGRDIGVQTTSLISVERTVYKIYNKMHD